MMSGVAVGGQRNDVLLLGRRDEVHDGIDGYVGGSQLLYICKSIGCQGAVAMVTIYQSPSVKL